MSEGQIVLRATDVTVHLGGREVLHDVNLDIRAGEVHSLLGPNGAGKTTLLRAMMGLNRPSRGTCEATGGIGYVPQRHDVAWEFPITAQQVVLTGLVRRIGYGRRARREHLEAAARALGRVRMEDLRERPIGEMSGGQRQRVLIARALALDPAVLLLDEPSTGVDMPTQEILTDLMRHLADEGTALLMTTHDLTHAMVASDRVSMLNGTILATGEPAHMRDPELWMRTFRVSERSPLLRQVGALVC